MGQNGVRVPTLILNDERAFSSYGEDFAVSAPVATAAVAIANRAAKVPKLIASSGCLGSGRRAGVPRLRGQPQLQTIGSRSAALRSRALKLRQRRKRSPRAVIPRPSSS